ncbi:hypothetical protein D9M72_376170 [compost metagenome]
MYARADCSPMKKVTCQASRSRHRPRTVKPDSLATGLSGSACGAQMNVTSAAGTAHMASASVQPPPSACSSGTVRPAALAAPPHTAMVYRPIISAACLAKSRFTRPESSTFDTAMPLPAMAEARNSSGMLPVPRSTVPTPISTMQPSSVRSVPKRRPSQGAIGANTPRQTIGSVVSRLAAVADRPVARMISGSTTDRLANTGRRLKAMSTTVRPSSSRRPRLGVGVGRGAGRLSTSASISSSSAPDGAAWVRATVAAPVGRVIALMRCPVRAR